MSGERLEKQCSILHGLRHRANLVKRTREGGDSVAAHAPVAWLESDDVAEARRLADGAARIRAKRGDRHVSADCGCASAGASARNARNVVWVARDAHPGVLRRRPHREFIHVDAPCAHGACRLEPLYYGRVVRAYIALEHLRCACAWLPLDVDEILYRHRDAKERGTGPSNARLVRSLRGL